MYAVVACPRCRRARIAEEGRKTVTCGACGRSLALADLRAWHKGADLEEARHAAGLVNAKLAGREKEFAAGILPADGPCKAGHDDAWHAAAAAMRRATGEVGRADAAARALTDALVEFGEDDLVCAFELGGMPASTAAKHLARMQATDIVFEPRAGRFTAF